jgi:hypothetical protein
MLYAVVGDEERVLGTGINCRIRHRKIGQGGSLKRVCVSSSGTLLEVSPLHFKMRLQTVLIRGRNVARQSRYSGSRPRVHRLCWKRRHQVRQYDERFVSQ